MYSKSVVVSFSYEFRVFAVKNFKSLSFFWTKVTQKRRTNAAHLEEEEDKEEDKTGVSKIALFLLLFLIFAFLVGFSSISLTLYRSDLPPARRVRSLFISSLC